VRATKRTTLGLRHKLFILASRACRQCGICHEKQKRYKQDRRSGAVSRWPFFLLFYWPSSTLSQHGLRLGVAVVFRFGCQRNSTLETGARRVPTPAESARRRKCPRTMTPTRAGERPSSAAAAALGDSERRKTRIAAAVCCSDWFGGAARQVHDPAVPATATKTSHPRPTMAKSAPRSQENE